MAILDLNSNSGIINLETFSISSRFTEITPLSSSELGHCELYKAKRFGKWHTLKVLKKDYANNTIYQGLIQKEFQISYSLSHPNIINTIGIEDIDSLGICIVFEYIDGVTLNEYLDTSKPNNKQIVKILSELCDALDYIHGKQIIHRDIKPSNIIITHNGSNVKLIDFGLSDSDSYAVLKQPAGTYPYASPEQCQNGANIDNRSDIYAIGMLIQQINNTRKENIKKSKKIIPRCVDYSRNNRFSSAKQISTLLNKQNNLAVYFITFITVISSIGFGYYQGINNLNFNTSQLDSIKTVQGNDNKNINILDKLTKTTTNHFASQFDSLNTQTINSMNAHTITMKAISESYDQYLDAYNTIHSSREEYINQLLQKHFSSDDPNLALYRPSLLKIAEDIIYKNFTKATKYYDKLIKEQSK